MSSQNKQYKATGTTDILTGHEESVHFDIHEQWNEWWYMVVRIPLIICSNISTKRLDNVFNLNVKKLVMSKNSMFICHITNPN